MDIAGPGSTNGYGQVRFTNASALGEKTTEQVKDADIDGSPYFDERWGKAIVLLQNGQVVKTAKLRIDLYRNEVHYVDSLGLELIAISGVVKKIFLLDRKDSTKIATVFQQIIGVDGNNATAFVQVLNTGNTALLKYIHVTIFKKGYDELAGKDNYTFLAKPIYCMLKNGVVTTLKGLDEKAVLGVVAPSADQTAWLQAHDNKLRNEKDIIAFLNYCNGIK